MNETLVSFETAKLAKEMGFFSDGSYHCYNECHEYPKGIIATVTEMSRGHRSTLSNTEDNIFEDCYEAPTQALLQKWLRDKFDVDIFIVASFIGEPKHRYSYYILCNTNDTDADGSESKTYEEALEIALLEALKLLEL